MQFHPEKCQVLRVSKKTRAKTICQDYTLHGHTLEVVDHAKYLGVTIAGNLRWDKHITNCVNKANSTLAVLKRNVRVPSKSVKSAAYKALVRPHLEYCCSVWDPNTKCLKDKLEKVQRRSARWVCNKYRFGPNTTGPTEMINLLDWPLLEAGLFWRQGGRLHVSVSCTRWQMTSYSCHIALFSAHIPTRPRPCLLTLIFLWTKFLRKYTSPPLSFPELCVSGTPSLIVSLPRPHSRPLRPQ